MTFSLGGVAMEKIYHKVAMEATQSFIRQQELMGGPVSSVAMIIVVNA